MSRSGGIAVKPWVLTVLALVVTIVWAVNILAGLVVSSWNSDAGVNAVMAALLALIGTIGGKSLFARTPHVIDPPAQEAADNDR